jgi:rhodanese-related sulfurtransferase
MDVALPANTKAGLVQDEIARRGWAVTAPDAVRLSGRPDVAFIDLREPAERARHGEIAGTMHLPYPAIEENIVNGGVLHELAEAAGKRLLFYCAYGERSAMAVQAARDAGLASCSHLAGGLEAWKKAGGRIVRVQGSCGLCDPS